MKYQTHEVYFVKKTNSKHISDWQSVQIYVEFILWGFTPFAWAQTAAEIPQNDPNSQAVSATWSGAGEQDGWVFLCRNGAEQKENLRKLYQPRRKSQ